MKRELEGKIQVISDEDTSYLVVTYSCNEYPLEERFHPLVPREIIYSIKLKFYRRNMMNFYPN